jgi:16S rRNA (cytidine1402-2'-O)-methyltransferase
VTAALSIAGVAVSDFAFLGFPPAKGSGRRTWFGRLAEERRTGVFFEAPHRIRKTLEDLLEYLGDRPILVARELTKAHEELVIRQITTHLDALDTPIGEFTVVVPPVETATTTEKPLPSDEDVTQLFGRITESARLSRREVARQIAERLGASPNWIYRRLSELDL